jgi:ATP-binding cassette subfamily C protein CydCD
VALWLIFAPAGLLALVLALIGLLLAPWIAIRADQAAGRATQRHRSATTRLFAGLLSAADELRANHADGPARQRLVDLDAAAGRAGRRSAWALGAGHSVVVFACCAVALLMLPLSAEAVANGTLAAPLVAVLVMTPLGLIEPLLDVTVALQQWPTLRQVLGRVSTVTVAQTEAEGPLPADFAGPVRSLELDGVSFRYPNAQTPAFEAVNAKAEAGDWLVVTGPSGSGKSTLLALLLRYLEPDHGRYLLNETVVSEIAAMDVRRHVAWCPQEGHLFNSTLRANLLIARPRDDAPRSAEMESVLARVGLGSLLHELPLGLDTPIGSEGSSLSGGQRQRVAVARTLLARSDVVLIDEPTAHLDEEAAAALMTDLRVALADKVTVLVTHKASDLKVGDRRLELAS